MSEYLSVFTDASYCNVTNRAFVGVVVQSEEGLRKYSKTFNDIYSSFDAEYHSVLYAITIIPKKSYFTLFNDCKGLIDIIQDYEKRKLKLRKKVKSVVQQLKKFEKCHFEWLTDRNENFIRECHLLAKSERKKRK